MEQNHNSTSGKLGNKCGHDPSAPRHFEPPKQHANRPAVLKRAIEAVRAYFNAPQTLPSLNAANESDRRQRSERRESCCALLGAILHYTDLVTLRVGIPQPDGSMAGLTMPFLARLAGIGERRAERAIHDLKAAGIITVRTVCEKIGEDAYKGYAAIRTVSRDLFEAVGLGRWLAHERRKATERRNQRTEKARRKALAKLHLALGGQHGPQSKAEGVGTAQTATPTNGLSPMAAFFAAARAKLHGPP